LVDFKGEILSDELRLSEIRKLIDSSLISLNFISIVFLDLNEVFVEDFFSVDSLDIRFINLSKGGGPFTEFHGVFLVASGIEED